MPGEGRYLAFSIMKRDKIENLPDTFCTGLKRSNLWSEESMHGGLAITNGVTILLPASSKGTQKDGFFVARLGFDEAWAISKSLGLGEEEA